MNIAIKTFGESVNLSQKIRTTRGYCLDLMQLCVFLRNPLITQITADQVIQYLNMLVEVGWDRNSLLAKSCAFRKFFKYWKQREYPVLNYQLVPIVQREFRMPRVASDDSLQKIISFLSCHPKRFDFIRNKAIVLLLRHSAMRVGELCSLNIQDLDLENKTALIKTEKTRGMRPARQVFWETQAHEALLLWIRQRNSLIRRGIVLKDPNALFIALKGATQGARITGGAVGIFLRKICRNIQIPTVNPHQLRHTRLHELVDQGASNSVISNIAGHSSLSSSFIYTILNDKELVRNARKYGVKARYRG